jgi:uncharacterized protein YkwD
MPSLLSRRAARPTCDRGSEDLSVFRPLVALLVVVSAIALGHATSANATIRAGHGSTKEERQFVQELLLEINNLRASHFLRPLRVGPALMRAADQHDREMGRLGYFSHDSANGTDFDSRIERYYPSGGARFWMAGENLLWSARDMTPRAVISAWMHSPPHRANLLRRDWRQVGISALRLPSAPGYFQHRRVWLVTTDFGVRY